MLTKGNSYHNFRDRIMGQNFGAIESDLDSLQLSNYENQDLSSATKFRNFRFLNYQTGTGDEGGGINNYDESATDNDVEFKSFLFGIGCQPASYLNNINLMRKGDSAPGAFGSQLSLNLNDIEVQK